MPVIGRLDEQVEQVLIAPLARKDTPTTQTQKAEAPPPTASETNAAPLNAKAEQCVKPTSSATELLPVWML
ncbi:MAG: hypothetical protein ABR577_08760 [Pyrinomonadaceae bacterium]